MNAKALYDFNPKELNQLPLRKDCIVLVIGKEGDSKGWWRGKALDRVCFMILTMLILNVLNDRFIRTGWILSERVCPRVFAYKS